MGSHIFVSEAVTRQQWVVMQFQKGCSLRDGSWPFWQGVVSDQEQHVKMKCEVNGLSPPCHLFPVTKRVVSSPDSSLPTANPRDTHEGLLMPVDTVLRGLLQEVWEYHSAQGSCAGEAFLLSKTIPLKRIKRKALKSLLRIAAHSSQQERRKGTLIFFSNILHCLNKIPSLQQLHCIWTYWLPC